MFIFNTPIIWPINNVHHYKCWWACFSIFPSWTILLKTLISFCWFVRIDILTSAITTITNFYFSFGIWTPFTFHYFIEKLCKNKIRIRFNRNTLFRCLYFCWPIDLYITFSIILHELGLHEYMNICFIFRFKSMRIKRITYWTNSFLSMFNHTVFSFFILTWNIIFLLFNFCLKFFLSFQGLCKYIIVFFCHTFFLAPI